MSDEVRPHGGAWWDQVEGLMRRVVADHEDDGPTTTVSVVTSKVRGQPRCPGKKDNGITGPMPNDAEVHEAARLMGWLDENGNINLRKAKSWAQ